MRVHDADCQYIAGTGNECGCRFADDEEWSDCAHCHEATAIDAIVHHGEDFGLCPKCSDEFIQHLVNCRHEFSPVELSPDWFEPGRHCTRCGVFWYQDWAISWFPFVCDGFVDIDGADA